MDAMRLWMTLVTCVTFLHTAMTLLLTAVVAWLVWRRVRDPGGEIEGGI